MIPDIITEGEFKGWSTWKTEAFEYDAAGPFHYKVDDKGVVCAFRVMPKHMNQAGLCTGDA